MTDIYPYGLIAEDPATEAVICWADDRDGADGSSQTLDWDDGSASSDGELVPESDDAYLYSVTIDGLDEDTGYSGTIDGEESVEWQTLPTDASSEITILLAADFHSNQTSGIRVDSAEKMRPLANQDPDVFVFGGDLVENTDEVTAEHTEDYLHWWENLYGEFDRLVPMFIVPGNHEVGGAETYDGSSPMPADNGYFQFWFKNPVELDPDGLNYGAVTIGDYIQLVGLDTHSADIEDSGEWLTDTLDESVDYCVPFQHAPLLPGGFRSDADEDLMERLRDSWAEHLITAPNVYASFSGHIHVRKRTNSVGFDLDNAPDSIELDEGYIVPDGEGSLIEYGDGYRTGRPLIDEWYLRYRTSNAHFYTIDIDESFMTVTERDGEGRVNRRDYFGASELTMESDNKISIESDNELSVQ